MTARRQLNDVMRDGQAQVEESELTALGIECGQDALVHGVVEPGGMKRARHSRAAAASRRWAASSSAAACDAMIPKPESAPSTYAPSIAVGPMSGRLSGVLQ